MNRFEKSYSKKFDCIKCNKNRKLKNLTYHISLIKHSLFQLFVVSVAVMMKKYLQKKNQ